MSKSAFIGANIKVHRLNQKLSLSELARRCNISKGTLHKVESGANLETNTLIAIAEALSISPSFLLFEFSIETFKDLTTKSLP